MTPPRGAGRASVASVKRTSLTEMLTRQLRRQKSDAARGIRRSGQIAACRRDAATGPAVWPPDLIAVVPQDGVDHSLPSVIWRMVMRMSLSSSPATSGIQINPASA
jgi:hypothetical protein